MTAGQGRQLETDRRNNVGNPEERRLEKNRKNDRDDGKCGIYDIRKMIEEKFLKYESCKWK